MQQLLADDEALKLVDEMFFEFHVREKYMGPMWSGGWESKKTTADAFKLFAALRRKGVRMHSWV